MAALLRNVKFEFLLCTPGERRRQHGPLLLHVLVRQHLRADGREGHHVDAVHVLHVVAEPVMREHERKYVQQWSCDLFSDMGMSCHACFRFHTAQLNNQNKQRCRARTPRCHRTCHGRE